MRPFRLNLSALRDDAVPMVRGRAATSPACHPTMDPAGSGYERVESSEAGHTTPFEIVDDGRRLAFRVGGCERWLIDPRRFGGAPLLTVERGEGTLRIELAGAFYPGTNFPADFVGELHQEGSVWCLRLQLVLGGFRAEFPFEPWLNGLEPASAPVTLTPPPLPLGARAGLIVRGKGMAAFAPNWSMTLQGDKLARFVGIGNALVADTVSLALPDRCSPSLLSHPADRRTVIDVTSLHGAWAPDLKQTARDGWAFLSEGCPFDMVRIEASEPHVGPIVRALRAEAARAEPKLFCQPVGRGAAWEGLGLKLALVRPRLAVAFDPRGDETALYADYANPPWRAAHSKRRRVDVGADPKRLELLIQSGELTWLTSPPTLPSLLSPLVSAVVNAPSIRAAGRLAIVPGAEDPSRRPAVPETAISAG